MAIRESVADKVVFPDQISAKREAVSDTARHEGGQSSLMNLGEKGNAMYSPFIALSYLPICLGFGKLES